MQRDASWRETERLAGLGWIVTNNLQDSRTQHSQVSMFVDSPLGAEGMAIRAALLQAVDKDIRSLTIESDSAQLINEINSKTIIAPLHGILSDINELANRFNVIVLKISQEQPMLRLMQLLNKLCITLKFENE
ncbi:unnamed protein product [Arabis nemorensis]|uniref:RNase H type-1 domain-containing protein n=1 Tax=Arabis nemorensis TaxID=586526 RepID=A0A565AVY9_9BRAS|nr:unnamed protein product [Arabis nemorensis]